MPDAIAVDASGDAARDADAYYRSGYFLLIRTNRSFILVAAEAFR
jgi:hypothetical protein